MARQRRPGRGRPRRRQAARAVALGAATVVPPGFRGLGVAVRPPGCAARLNEAMRPSFAEVPAAAARANSGGAEEGAPARSDSDPARSDASASFPGSAEGRRFGPDGPRAWGVADCRSSPNRALGAGPPLNRRAVFSDASPSSTIASGAASGWARRGSGPGFAAFGMGFGRAFESCPIRQSYRTSPPHDKRGGIVATQRDKPPRKIHHAAVIRADLKLLADRLLTVQDGVSAPPREARASQDESSENPGTADPVRRASIPAWARASGRAGEGDPLFAAGAGLALLDACPARRSARRRRAARPPRAAERRGFAPKSCASTPTKPRCATSASPSATRSGPRRTFCRCGAMAPAGRPASTPAGLSTQRRGSTWLWTRTASQRA